MKKNISIAVILLAASAYGADLSQRVVTPSGIVVHLPAGWQQVPKDVLTAQFVETARQNPNLPEQTYEYGFQAPSDQWFSHPYVLVQIQRAGRVPEAALKKLPNLDEIMGNEMDKALEAASTIADAAMGKTVYDSGNRILWWSARMNYAGIGNIKMLAGSHLSEDGFVQVLSYAREEDSARDETLLKDIITRVELPDGMRYVPKLTDNLPLAHVVDWNNVLSKGLPAAVLGFLACGILGVKMRKKKTPDQSTEDTK